MQRDQPVKLPLIRREIAIGTRSYTVETVEDQDALLASSENCPQFPFGLMLWESAVALADHIARQPCLVQGRTVLDLGCGIGLVGVVAASLGGDVTLSDHDPAALAIATATAELNGIGSVRILASDWHHWQDTARHDVIAGADVTYDGADHAALLEVFEKALAPGGRVMLADPGRQQLGKWIAAATTAGWHVARTSHSTPDLRNPSPDARITIAILSLTRDRPHRGI